MFKNSISILLLGLMLLLPLYSPAQAQNQTIESTGEIVEPDRQELPLPENAIWRFGQMDSTQSNGYYLIAFSPDGKLLATRNRKNVVEIRSIKTRELVCEIGAHDTRIKHFEFSPDSRYVLTVATSREPVKVWDVRTGNLELEIKEKTVSARFSAAGDSILTLGTNRVAEFSWPHGDLVRRLDQAGAFDRGNILGLAMDSSGRRIVAHARSNNRQFNLTKLIDIKNKSSIILPGPSQTPRQLIFSPDDTWVAAVYPRKAKVRIWNLTNPQELKFDLEGHASTVEFIAFSQDSRFLVSTGWDRRFIIWDLQTKKPITNIEAHAERVSCAAFSPIDFKFASAASGLKDSTGILWDMKTAFLPGQPEPLEDEQQFQSAWIQMGSPEPKVALRNVHAIKSSLENCFDRLENLLGGKTVGSEDRIHSLIAQLQADTFAKREAATEKLIELRGTAERFLMETLKDAESPELKYRLTRILDHAISRPEINPSELRRLHRAIYLLELVARDTNSSFAIPAAQLLRTLSLSHPHIDIARDASQTIARIKGSGK